MAATKPLSKGFTGISPKSVDFFANNPPQTSFNFYVDMVTLESRLGYVTGRIDTLFSRISPYVADQARNILFQVFDEAINRLGKAFFADLGYRNQVLAAIATMPIRMNDSPRSGFLVEVDFDALGTYDDVIIGFHRGALIAPASKSDYGHAHIRLPYTGERLALPYSRRYAFWTAIYNGVPFQSSDKRGHKSKTISTEGLLEATIQDRVNIWAAKGKAPEWLYLEFGQMRSEPIIPPGNLIEDFQLRMQRWINNTIDDELSDIMTEAEAIREEIYGSFEYYNPITGVRAKTLVQESNFIRAQESYQRYYNQGVSVQFARMGRGGLYVGLRGSKGRYVSF